MSTDIDWQHEIDRSFGTGVDVPVSHYATAGRTALRRRRRLASAVGIGAAALVLGAAWSIVPDPDTRSEAPIADDRSESPGPDRTATEEPPRKPARARLLEQMRNRSWHEGDAPARSFPGGFQVREGAVVHDRRDDLYPGKDTESVALDLTFDGVRWWVLLEWDDGGSTTSSEKPTDGMHASFDAFVAASTEGGGMTSGPVEDPTYAYGGLVSWSGGEPALRPGATLVRAVQDPIGTQEDSIGLVVRAEGEVTWMVIMLDRHGAGATSEKAAESGWPTFDLWLSEQVALQTGEPGLRLVEPDVDGTVSPALADVEVLDQRADPDLPAYGTDAATASAVALVDWRDERWFVLALLHPDQDSITTFAASKADGAETIDEFIAFAESRADEGGLR